MLRLVTIVIPFILGVVTAKSQEKGSLFNWNNLWQSQTYYEVLQVNELATVKEIKKAYRKMAVIMHPDKLDIRTDEDKISAEKNFIQLARAYEILSDDKVKRRRYDCLVKEGVMEYPDDINYNWDWVDQKIGLKAMHYRDESAFWARGSRNTYEDAKKFYEAEEKWSWETDTTLQDMRDNPLALMLMLGTVALFFIPRQTYDKVINMASKLSEKKKLVNSINRSKKVTPTTAKKVDRNRKDEMEKVQKLQEEEMLDEEEEQLERTEMAKMDLIALLQAHIGDITVSVTGKKHVDDDDSKSEANFDWRSVGEGYTISSADVVYVCDRIKDIDMLNEYADCIVEAFPCDEEPEKEREELINCKDDNVRGKNELHMQGEKTQELLRRILEHVVLILDDRNIQKKKAAEAHVKNKVKSSRATVNPSREWDAAMVSCLAKGVNKYQSHRKRWDLVTDYMNHILSPAEPFTKPECIQQAQAIQNIQKEKQQQGQSSIKLDSRTPTSNSTSNEIKSTKQSASEQPTVLNAKNDASSTWSVIQQKQLEQGLQSFASVQGAAKWKAIGNCVKGKTSAECVERFKFLRSELQKKKNIK